MFYGTLKIAKLLKWYIRGLILSRLADRDYFYSALYKRTCSTAVSSFVSLPALLHGPGSFEGKGEGGTVQGVQGGGEFYIPGLGSHQQEPSIGIFLN